MECKVCKWAGKNINMHLRHSTKCKELYSEDEIMGLKKEMKSVRNKRYKSKAVNKIANEKYNEAYREKPENKIAKQKHNKTYREKPENKIAKQKYNKTYRKKPKHKILKPKYNRKYKEKPENKIEEQKYNKFQSRCTIKFIMVWKKIEQGRKDITQNIIQFITKRISKRLCPRGEQKLASLLSIF